MDLFHPNSLTWDSKTFDKFFALAYACDEIAVDTETMTLGDHYDIRDGTSYALGLSVAFGLGDDLSPSSTFSGYFPFRHLGDNLDRGRLLELKKLIESSRVIFHHAKFDLVSLATLGIHHEGKFFDTMLLAHMIDENLYSKELDYLAKEYLRDEGKRKSPLFQEWTKKLGWSRIPAEVVAEYGAYDSNMTFRLKQFLWPIMEDEGLAKLWPTEEKFVRLLIRMESRGVRIDTALAKSQEALGQAMMDDLAETIGVNPGSPKQLEELLIGELGLPVVKTTPAGKPSFDKGAMQEYEELLAKSDDPRASYILEYRGWQKTVTSNYRPYLTLLSPDGRLRPNYKIHGTVTGRLSCEKPNLQQIPRVSDKAWNGSLKACFIPADGFTLWEADYSQLELRLGAAYGKEEKLITVFRDPERDVFTEMSQQVGMSRQDTKTLTYTIQYGGGVKRISTVFNVHPSVAARIKDQFYATYPGIKEVSALASRRCRQQKYITLWTGRRRHFRFPSDEAHKAFNSAIQGGAAEIVKHTMLRLGDTVDSDDCRMLLQVHDSVVFEIRNGMEDVYLPKIKEIMEDVQPDFGVPFKVDVHKWGE